MSMIERVARAIDPKAWAWLDGVAGQKPPHPASLVTRVYQLRQARAAIEAMREPADEMLLAASEEVWKFSPDYAVTEPDPHGENEKSGERVALLAWRRMIDAALSPQDASVKADQPQHFSGFGGSTW